MYVECQLFIYQKRMSTTHMVYISRAKESWGKKKKTLVLLLHLEKVFSEC